ncbi:MAG: hypothetical protein HDP34_04705 [Clostridia bacterium]|nr:hypothetical protein [Clostridia bacterium]
MKLKKLFSVVLAFAIGATCFAFAACDDEENGNDEEEKTEEEIKDETENEIEDEKEEIVLTEDTDFSALVSEKVTEEEWQAVFNEENYKDCTIKLFNEKNGNYYRKSQSFGDDINVEVTREYSENFLSTYYEFCNGKRFAYGKMNGAEEFTKIEYPQDNYEVFDNWSISYTMFCPNFGALFEHFIYNEQTGAYEFNGRDYCDNRNENKPTYNPDCEGWPDCTHANLIITNSILEYWNAHYFQASVKIINSKLACVEATISINPKECIYFYDFGNTVVNLPNV